MLQLRQDVMGFCSKDNLDCPEIMKLMSRAESEAQGFLLSAQPVTIWDQGPTEQAPSAQSAWLKPYRSPRNQSTRDLKSAAGRASRSRRNHRVRHSWRW